MKLIVAVVLFCAIAQVAIAQEMVIPAGKFKGDWNEPGSLQKHGMILTIPKPGDGMKMKVEIFAMIAQCRGAWPASFKNDQGNGNLVLVVDRTTTLDGGRSYCGDQLSFTVTAKDDSITGPNLRLKRSD